MSTDPSLKTSSAGEKNDQLSPNQFRTSDGKVFEIRDVWMSNIDIEMENIRKILDKYPYVAMVFISHYSKLCIITYLA